MTLLKLEFKSLFRGLALWTGILALMLIVLMAFFPFMESGVMADLVGDNRSVLPMPLLAFLGLSRIPNFTNVTVYFAFVMQYVNVAAVVYVALRGATTLVKEEHDGTISYLYAQPITRSGIVIEKMVANFLAYGMMIMILWTLAMGLALVFSTGSQKVLEMLFEVTQICSGTFVMGIIVMVMGFYLSVNASGIKQARIAIMVLILGTYLLGVISSLADSVAFLSVLSPLNIFEPSRVLAGGIDFKALSLWGSIGIIAGAMTFVNYNKKDFKNT